MARAATTSDVFNAVAERRRRRLIDALAGGAAYPVGRLVRTVRMPQPTVSKHLAVLRRVGVVQVHRRGRERLYSLNAAALRPVHTWVKGFERFWTRHLDAIKQAAERKAQSLAAQATPGTFHKPEPT